MAETAEPVPYAANGPTGVDGVVWAGPDDIDAAIIAAAGGDGGNLDRATLDRVWSLQQEYLRAQIGNGDIVDAKAEALAGRVVTGVIALAAGAAWLFERQLPILAAGAGALALFWCVGLLMLVFVVRPRDVPVLGLDPLTLFRQRAGGRLVIDEQQVRQHLWRHVLQTAAKDPVLTGAVKKKARQYDATWKVLVGSLGFVLVGLAAAYAMGGATGL